MLSIYSDIQISEISYQKFHVRNLQKYNRYEYEICGMELCLIKKIEIYHKFIR